MKKGEPFRPMAGKGSAKSCPTCGGTMRGAKCSGCDKGSGSCSCGGMSKGKGKGY